MRSDAVMMTRRYSRTGMLRAAIALVATLLVVSAVIPPGPSADAATRCTGSEWVGAWTAAPSNAGLASEPAPSRALVDQTVRMVVRPTLAGSRARVRLTHRYGAIALPGARDVIILLGVNDLGGDEQRTARQLIDGLATMTRRAKRTGLRVHLGTLTPSGGVPQVSTRRTARNTRTSAGVRSTGGSGTRPSRSTSSTSTRPCGIHPLPHGCGRPSTPATTYTRTPPATWPWPPRSESPAWPATRADQRCPMKGLDMRRISTTRLRTPARWS